MRLDKKDRKILYELDLNSRQPYTHLAKRVGLSQESVRYRVERLARNNVIFAFFTIINPWKVNVAFYKVLLRLHNANNEKRAQIIKFLVDNKRVRWTVDMDGSYDIGLVVGMPDIVALHEFLEKLYEQFHTHISKHDLSVNMIGEYLTRDYFIGKEQRRHPAPTYEAKQHPFETDDMDLRVISALTMNARTKSVEIAQTLRITPDTVAQRIKKLEREKVILHYNIMLNHSNIGQIHYKVLIYLSDFSPEKRKRFVQTCRTISRIVFLIRAMGKWNYELDIEVEDIDQFRQIMTRLTTEFSDIIRDYDALIIRKIHKYNLYP